MLTLSDLLDICSTVTKAMDPKSQGFLHQEAWTGSESRIDLSSGVCIRVELHTFEIATLVYI